ncbi:MAG: addiction module protein [Gammaproteobacteria bacterium]|nr:addiction module protein [Gammaproteobacteria bacterium]MBU1834173.1 addiction module protein [Gammaproteobacteria bacterium]
MKVKLQLSREERAKLIQRLVLSLELPSGRDLRSDWLLEARRRSDELDSDLLIAVSGDDVIRRARALTK